MSHQLIQTLSRVSLIALCRVIIPLAVFNLTCASPVGVTQPYSEVTGSCEGTEGGSLTLLRKLPFIQSKTPFPAAGTQLLIQPDWLIFRCLKASLLAASHSPVHQGSRWLNRMTEFGFQLEGTSNHLIPTPLPMAGTPSTNPDCSNTHPTWP